jgi:glycosyltransferase involved in cell wall biosynthesis
MVGVPYVASDFPEMKHVHETVKGGILTDPSNLKEVASAIETLLTDTEGRKKMGRMAREAALSEFNWEVEQRRLLGIVSNLFQQ